MVRATVCAASALVFLVLGWSRAEAVETLRGDVVSVTIDQGRFAVQARGQAAPFATGALRCQGKVKLMPVDDAVFGQGKAIVVAGDDGAGETFQVFDGLPLVLYQATLVNPGAAGLCSRWAGRSGTPWLRWRGIPRPPNGPSPAASSSSAARRIWW